MTGQSECSAIVWIGIQTDLHRATVVARDTCRGVSLTNLAEDMIKLVERFFLVPDRFSAEETVWIYRDSMGRWDHIVPERISDAISINFKPLDDRTVDAAKKAITSYGFNVNEYPLRELMREITQ